MALIVVFLIFLYCVILISGGFNDFIDRSSNVRKVRAKWINKK